jgi:hypothetical protein
MLFLGPKATLATAAQVELAAWARDVNNRSASSAEELANPAYPQQTLRYLLTKTAEKLPATLKIGRPPVEYTFQTGAYIGKTLPQVLHSNASYFYYLLGEGPGDKKVWKFDDTTKVDEDWRLYVECEKLCENRGGTPIVCHVPYSDPIVWNLGIRPNLKDAFETYVRTKLGTEESRAAAATEFERACAQRRASQAAQAGGEEDDEGEAPVVTEPTEVMSRVNAATLELFKETCKSLAKGHMDAYETWPNRMVRAPDPFKCLPFSKAAWECLDIDFFDIRFYPLIDEKCLPCINGGYEHAEQVRLRDSQWRKPRLVKGAERETCITGRNYVCRECERKYRSLQGQLQMVEQQLSERDAPPADLDVDELELDASELTELRASLTAKLKALSFRWAGYHPSFIAKVAERYPFMLSALDCVFSHHAAIDLPTALRIERAGRVGQPATDLEAELREIRKILQCRRDLAYCSVQRLTLEREARKSVLAQVDARKTFECEVRRCERRVARSQSDLEMAKEALASVPAETQAPAQTGEVVRGKAYVVKSWVHMNAAVGKISDTFITAHIASHELTFDKFRTCWTEQYATFGGRPAAFDHSGKHGHKTKINGELGLTWTFSGMNWAGLVSVFTRTFGTSLNESSVRAAMRDKAKAEERWQSAPPTRFYCDKPRQDGPALEKLLLARLRCTALHAQLPEDVEHRQALSDREDLLCPALRRPLPNPRRGEGAGVRALEEDGGG